MNNSDYFLIAGVLLIDVFAFFTIIKKILKEYFYLNWLVKSGNRTEGEIIDYTKKDDLDGYTQFAPIIRYFDNNSQEHVINSQDFSFSKPIVGRKVKICYNAENPASAIDNYKVVLLYKAFAILLISIVLLSINIAMLYKVFA